MILVRAQSQTNQTGCRSVVSQRVWWHICPFSKEVFHPGPLGSWADFSHPFVSFCVVVLFFYNMSGSDLYIHLIIVKFLFVIISELPRYWYSHNSLQSNRTQTSKSSGTESSTNTSKAESWVPVQEEMTTVSRFITCNFLLQTWQEFYIFVSSRVHFLISSSTFL